jgi:hypothetical protein
MTKKKLLLFVAMTTLLTNSCDQVESKYSDYNEAERDKLFEKGWIPKELTFESMTNIYQRTNLDLNTCFFQFNLSSNDLQTAKASIQPTTIKFEQPRRVNLPNELKEQINKLDHYLIVDEINSDTVFVAIEEQKNLVYGWRRKF